ncbi:hypothetical protein CSUI_008803, partial [Cystoisospora suis]
RLFCLSSRLIRSDIGELYGRVLQLSLWGQTESPGGQC